MRFTSLLVALLAFPSAAFAADLGTKSVAPASSAGAYQFYFGGVVGHAWGREALKNNGATADGNGINADLKGHLYGIKLGADYNLGRFKVGLVADVMSSRMGQRAMDNFRTPVFGQFDVRWMASLDARAGANFGDHTIYAVSGLSLASESHYILGQSFHKDRDGWNFGFGAETALSKNWMAFAEYKNHRFGKENYYSNVIRSHLIDFNLQSVVAGVAYKM
jgi:outer membrane immunogenic protein